MDGPGPGPDWTAALDRALADANIPTLLMVLGQLTGDPRWLAPRFQCGRPPGLDDHDTGGLDDATRAEITATARDAIPRARNAPGAPPARPPETLAAMMRLSTGERIPDGYGAIVAAGLGQDAAYALDQRHAFDPPPGYHVVIIGAGIAGLCMAIRLLGAGIACTVIEKNAALGGTWHENRYPGAGVDTPSHIYSFSFAPHDWTMHFALQPEIAAYVEHVADRFAVRPHIRFGTRVTEARFDEAQARWLVRTEGPDGRAASLAADVLIGAVGYLNVPKVAAIDGIDRFAGACFHTARWPEGLDLRGRRVAVIGNGATAMQIVPEIAPHVRGLTVFQRSRQWAAPFDRFRQPIAPGARFLLREVPLYQAWYRQRLAWIFNDRVHAALQIDPDWPHPARAVNAQNDRHRAFFTDYIKAELGARQDLLPALLPDYPPFGKRMLMDNGWFRAMTRDNVRLVTGQVARVVPDGVVAEDGSHHAAEVLVIATGFDAVNMLASFALHGRSGLSIREAWRARGPAAHLGMNVPGFPNFFILSGPNTGLGHGGSVVAALEAQATYVLAILRQVLATAGPGATFEVRRDAHDDYVARVDAAHARMIWTHPGMRNWYRDESGRVVLTTPFRNDRNWHDARRASLSDFVLTRREQGQAA